MPTPELCRKHGVSQQTFYRWKAKYGGMQEIEIWRQDYNQRRPHRSLGYRTPEEFAQTTAKES